MRFFFICFSLKQTAHVIWMCCWVWDQIGCLQAWPQDVGQHFISPEHWPSWKHLVPHWCVNLGSGHWPGFTETPKNKELLLHAWTRKNVWLYLHSWYLLLEFCTHVRTHWSSILHRLNSQNQNCTIPHISHIHLSKDTFFQLKKEKHKLKRQKM